MFKVLILKEKTICEYLNMLRQTKDSAVYSGLVWCPKSFEFEKEVGAAIGMAGGLSYEVVLNDAKLKRPTLFHTNEFYWAFQQLTNTYGIPTYKEVNPAFLSIVTFPFLFGVIFGDLMHGSLLLIFSMYLCLFKFKPGTAIHTYLIPGRYLFLMMGISAVFNGFIYNEYASMTT